MLEKTSPIAVFDSGMGGISVLKEMVKAMPQEDFMYFGDSINAPYGTKTVEEVRDLTIGHITRFIEKDHVKAIAIACNTATSAAVSTLRKMYPEIPLVGVEPAVKPAVNSCDHPIIVVMATPRTLKEKKFHNLEELYLDRAKIYPLPCPGLMEFVERGILEGPELEAFLTELLQPYLSKGITGIVLGCTHYPFVKNAISKVAGPSVTLFDGSEGTARELKRRISVANLLREESHQGTVTFYNSSPDPSRIALSEFLFRNESCQE